METFDPKPKLRELHGQPLPESIRKGQRLTSMTSGYDPRIAQSEHKFAPNGTMRTRNERAFQKPWQSGR